MSLNLDKGTCVSELEALIMVMDRLLQDKLQANPKSGIVFNRGEPNELKVRYADAQKALENLKSTFAYKGAFSFGICKTCKKFKNEGYSTGMLGKCSLSKSVVGGYDTCDKHSKSGGGFGL